jgi:predicted secreted hydrolase
MRALAAEPADEVPPPVLPGYAISFPRDYGSHPQFRIEWWYVTGWLTTEQHETLGFQVTFFRTRPDLAGADVRNPSHFNPQQLLFAHVALSDPSRGRPWQEQRIRRAGLGLAEAREGDTAVWIDDWRFERRDGRYQAQISAQQFELSLVLRATQPPLLNGVGGFSRKGPDPRSASYYYSEPHLRVSGRIRRAGREDLVQGEAWLDHEWSSEYLDPAASGWDWTGINLEDGGAVMAFRIRARDGSPRWAAATVSEPAEGPRSFGPAQVQFRALRHWRSPHSGIDYPVAWELRVGDRTLTLEPLLDDQEFDARLSSGARYWEGAVRVSEAGRPLGRGYLELTGYDHPLSLH